MGAFTGSGGVVEFRGPRGVLLLGLAWQLRELDWTYGSAGGSLRGREAVRLLPLFRSADVQPWRLRAEALRLGVRGVNDRTSNEELIHAVIAEVDAGLLSAIYLPDRLHPLFTLSDLDALASPSPGLPPPAAGAGAISSWSIEQKISEALKRVPRFLAGELKQAFEALVSPTSLALLVGAFVALAVAQAYGVGELVDAGLAAYAYYVAGLAGLSAIYDLVANTVRVSKAKTDEDIDAAAKRYAHDVTVLGVSVLTFLMARFKRKSKGASDQEAPPDQLPKPAPAPKPRSGGRLGSAATRAQNAEIAADLREQGYETIGGGGEAPEEYIRGPGPGTTGSTYVDVTAQNPETGETVRVQTIDTLADGSPTPREAAAAARIRAAYPNDTLLLIPKK